MRIRNLGPGLAAACLLLTPPAVADDLINTAPLVDENSVARPTVPSSGIWDVGVKTWMLPQPLIPAEEWKSRVGRISAFSGGTAWSSDPARMPVLSGIKAQPRRAAAKSPKAPDAPASAPAGQGGSAPSGQGASAPAGQGTSQTRQNPANAAGAGAVAALGPAMPPGAVSGLAPALPAGTAGPGAMGVSGNGLFGNGPSGALPATADEPNLVVPAGSAAHGSGNPRPNFAGGQGSTSGTISGSPSGTTSR
jgi:hypothetical protein